MTLEIRVTKATPAPAQALARVVFEGEQEATGGASSEFLRLRRFQAKPGEAVVMPGEQSTLLILAGAGRKETLDAEKLRRVLAEIVRSAWDCESLLVDLAGVPLLPDPNEMIAAAAEGVLLASYSYGKHKTDPRPCRLGSVSFTLGDQGPLSEAEADAAIERASVVAQGVNLARDLVNDPAGDLYPQRFCELAAEVAQSVGLGVEVWDEVRIKEEGLGGLAGVGAGSARPPRLLKLTYEAPGTEGTPPLALVGKGITFDSGGLSLKPAGGMETMKTDMSGAAAILGALSAMARLGVRARVVGILALSENMPSGSATKPGDVLRARNGKTIEVLNTDAEGRLVLADALSLAAEQNPAAIVDLATLTGACVVALGRDIAGVFSNGEGIGSQLKAAAEAAGEKIWPLPLAPEYRSHIDSEVADMKNIGAPGQAGATAAALLLAEFVGEVPWAHLDIAGPARSHEERGYQHKGGSGFGVRTLVRLASSLDPAAL